MIQNARLVNNEFLHTRFHDLRHSNNCNGVCNHKTKKTRKRIRLGSTSSLDYYRSSQSRGSGASDTD